MASTSARGFSSGWRKATGSSSPEMAATTFAAHERTLPAILSRQAARFGDRRLLVTSDASWSYADTATIARRAAATFAQVGVKSGDAVAILCGNRIEFMQAY